MLERVGYLAVFNLIGCLHPNEDGKPCSHRDVATFWPEEVRGVYLFKRIMHFLIQRAEC